MDRNVSAAIIVLAVLVGGLFWWGWRKAVGGGKQGVGSRDWGVVRKESRAGAASGTPALPAPHSPQTAKPAVLSGAAPPVATAPDDSFWLWDGELLATRSLDDLATYRQEDDRPPVGFPNGTTRNPSGQTPKQRELLSAGYVVVVPVAARVRVVTWGSDDLVQVRVAEGEKAGATGWINRHLLRHNRNGVFEAAYPVEIK